MKAGIAGAGILGRLFAFALHREGWDVTLFDQYNETDARICSLAAAGLLTPISELDKSEIEIFRLGQESIKQLWPVILSQLDEEIYFRQSGSIILAHTRDQAELSHFIRRIKCKLNSLGVEQLSQNDIQVFEPEITKFHHGCYFSDEAHIDNQTLFTILGNHLNKRIRWHKNTFVESIYPGKIVTKNFAHTFDMVFDCRGLGAKSQFSDLRGIRGELVWLHAPDVTIQRPVRLLHPRYSIYIVPRPKNIYLIGASEIESEDANPISVKTTLELLTAAYYLHPGFAEACVVKTVVGHRPTLSHHLPKIKYCNGLIAINGLYRHGYLISPALVHEVLQYINGGVRAIRYSQLWEKYHDFDFIE